MKLTDDIKKRIDDYFDHISPEDLYNLSVTECGFVEVQKEDSFCESTITTWKTREEIFSSLIDSCEYIENFYCNLQNDLKGDFHIKKIECKSSKSNYIENYSNNDPSTPLAA